jgi:curved DNA-binding protein
MELKDHYQTLGLAHSASSEDVKKAYRRLARKYHPDVSTEPNAEECFKAISEAYEILSDAHKRRTYDQIKHRPRTGPTHRPPPPWGRRTRASRQSPTAGRRLSAFFESLFGNVLFAHDGHRRRGADQYVKLEIGLEESYRGSSRTVALLRSRHDALGPKAPQTRSLNVKIPPGIGDGQKIRLIGQGKPGRNGGPRGDLYLEIILRPHEVFRVENRDLITELPVTPCEAALGARLKAPTLGGDVTLRIPAGSRSGQRLRLRGRGLPGDPPGDQYVVLKIVNPPADSPPARSPFRRMAQEFSFDPRAKLKK